MVAQGAGGAFEVSQRLTAMVGWAATADVDKFAFDGAAECYALDPQMAAARRRSNPEALKLQKRAAPVARGGGPRAVGGRSADGRAAQGALRGGR